MEFGDARVGAEIEKYGILGKTVKIIKTPLARHNKEWPNVAHIRELSTSKPTPKPKIENRQIFQKRFLRGF